MTILGIKVDFSGESQGQFIEEYIYYTTEINEDDHTFWDYYAEMREKNQEFVEDYTRSNQHYPKLCNLTLSSEEAYNSLPEDRKLVASWVWFDCPSAH